MARNLYVGTGVTENYLPKAAAFAFFESLNQNAQGRVKAFTLLLDFSPDGAKQTREKYPNIRFIDATLAEMVRPDPDFKCLQHGAFITKVKQELGLDDADYVLYVDTDLTMQRPFDDAEVDALLEGKVFAATNWHDEQMLLEEAPALHIKVPLFQVLHAFPNIGQVPCLNTGVLGATVAQWERILKSYVPRGQMINEFFGHYAKMQWLLCYVIHSLKLPVWDNKAGMTNDIHQHGHDPRCQERLAKYGVRKVEGVWLRNGRPIVFAHNLLSR
jgi:hypothetical protein